MSIIQIGPYPVSPDCIRGGVESSVFGLTQELVHQGHTVLVFDVPRRDVEDHQAPLDSRTTGEPLSTGEGQGRCFIYRYHNSGSHNEDAVFRVPDMVRDIIALHPDAIHIHGTGEISASLYYALHQQGYTPMVTIHGLLAIEKRNAMRKSLSYLNPLSPIGKEDLWHRIKRLMKSIYQYHRQSRIEYRFLESIPRAIVDTGYLLDALKSYPVKRLPVLHVIPQGANERFYEQEKREMRNDKREGRTEKTILCVGTFSQRKSQLELIRAFELLRSRGVEAKLDLCGIIAEQTYYEKVCAAVESSAYRSDISIYVNLSQFELMEHYRSAYIFALHSQEESQGIVFAEAMAMGLPVVSTRVGGIPYVVLHDECGLLTPYGDAEAMSVSLEKLLTDSPLYHMMSARAIELAENYRWQKIAEKILDLYQN